MHLILNAVHSTGNYKYKGLTTSESISLCGRLLERKNIQIKHYCRNLTSNIVIHKPIFKITYYLLLIKHYLLLSNHDQYLAHTNF